MKIAMCAVLLKTENVTHRDIDLIIIIRKSFIAKCVCTHNESVLVLGACSTESTNIVQTTYN